MKKKTLNALYKNINGKNIILINSKPHVGDKIVHSNKIYEIDNIESIDNVTYFNTVEGIKLTNKQFMTVFVCDEYFSEIHLKAIEDGKIKNNTYVKVEAEYSDEIGKLIPVLRNDNLIIRKCKEPVLKKKDIPNKLDFEKIKTLKTKEEFNNYLKSL